MKSDYKYTWPFHIGIRRIHGIYRTKQSTKDEKIENWKYLTWSYIKKKGAEVNYFDPR